MKMRAKNFGFTLLELVLVMMIIATVLAAAAPRLTGWSRGTKLRDAGDQFLSLTKYARTQAIADCRVYRLNVDAGQGAYWLTIQQGQQFANLGSDFGRIFLVPDG